MKEMREINDCWSLMLAESGNHRLDNLSQLLSLTSIIEREYTHICASRILNGQTRNGTGMADQKDPAPQAAEMPPAHQR